MDYMDLVKLECKLNAEEPDFEFKKLHQDAVSPIHCFDNWVGWSLHAINDYVFDMEDLILVETGMSISIGKGFEGIIGPIPMSGSYREDLEPSFRPFAYGDEIVGFNRILEAGKDTKLTIKFQNRFKDKDRLFIPSHYQRLKKIGGKIRVEKGDIVATIIIQKIGLRDINEKLNEYGPSINKSFLPD